MQPARQLNFGDLPMSLADACLVRMAEQHSQGSIFTVDGDFRRYRKHGRQVLPTLMPHDCRVLHLHGRDRGKLGTLRAEDKV